MPGNPEPELRDGPLHARGGPDRGSGAGPGDKLQCAGMDANAQSLAEAVLVLRPRLMRLLASFWKERASESLGPDMAR